VAPDGVEELLAAEEWGCPPWVIAEAPSIWMERWIALRIERARKWERDHANEH
jgi:hypothetical protein